MKETKSTREIKERLNEPAKVGELVLTAIIIMGFNFVGWIVTLFILSLLP